MTDDTCTTGDLDHLISQYVNAQLNRREFVRRALMLGLSVSGAASLLAGVDSGAAVARTERVKRGGTLRWGYDRDFTKMDTVQSGWADPSYVALYEFPIIRDPRGYIVPSLFESWKVASDGLTWTLKLRSGLKFQSGTPVTPKTIVDNFNVFRDPKVGQNAVFWKTVQSVSVGSGNEVIVKMAHPFAAFPQTLATEYSMIENLATRKKLADQYGAKGTDGTGPFTLAQFTPGQQVRVKRWESYPGSITPFLQNHGKAYLDEVQWVPIIEPSNRANEIETGSVDVLNNPAAQDISRLRANGDLMVLEWPAVANAFLGLNLTRKNLGFNDLRVRQAISHAIDRHAIVKAVFFGHGVATYGPVPPNFRWYNRAVEQYNRYDPALAKHLLDSAGWKVGSGGVRQKGGHKLSFTHINWAGQSDGARIMEAVQAMLGNVGIRMQVRSLETAAFFPALNKGPDSFGYEWLWSSPMDVLVIFATIPSTAFNGNMQNLQQAFNAWQSAGSNAQLKSAAYRAQLIWAKQLPKIPLVTPNQVWVNNKKVHGWRPTQTMLYPLLNDVWIG